MFRSFFTVSLAVLAACSLAAQSISPPRVGVGMIQRKLTLQDAITRALSSNLDIEIERTNTAAAGEGVRGARGFFDPNFRWVQGLQSLNTPVGSVLQGADGKLTERVFNQSFYFRKNLPFAGSSLGVDFENNRQSSTNPFLSLSPFLTSRLAVSFTQPLLRNRAIDLGRAQLKIRRKQLDISETQFELKAIDVITAVEQAYWDLVAARQDAQVKADAVELAREQLARNKRMVGAGTLAPVEISASQAELERRMDDWYSSVGVITQAENGLKTLISSNRSDSIWNDEMIPVDDRMLAPPEADDLRAAVNEALRQRPELKSIAGQQEINSIQTKENANQVKPQVNLVATYGSMGLAGSVVSGSNIFSQSNELLYTRVNQLSTQAGLVPIVPPSFGGVPNSLVGGYGTTLSNLFGGRYQSVQVGLQLDFTVHNNAAEANLAQSAIAERRLKLQRAQAEQVIQAQVRNALQGIQTAQQRIAAAEASVRAAREKLESETRLFQTGESTNFLVLTRQNEYADSRHRLLVAQLAFNKAVAFLEQALGSTLREHKLSLK